MINSITASNYSITPSLDYLAAKLRVKFNGSCLKEDKITYNQGKIVNIYIVYEISKNFNISILHMELDLIEKESFQWVMDLVKML